MVESLPHRTNGPQKERGLWQEGDGRKAQCTFARIRPGLTHGGADTWKLLRTVSGAQRVQRNVQLGEARLYTKPLARRALRDYVDRVNNYQPLAVKAQTMGKASTPFVVFAARWQEEVLIHKKASTSATVKGHINNSLIPAFGKLAMG